MSQENHFDSYNDVNRPLPRKKLRRSKSLNSIPQKCLSGPSNNYLSVPSENGLYSKSKSASLRSLQNQGSPFKFHASPVPKYNNTIIRIRSVTPLTIPQTPKFMKRYEQKKASKTPSPQPTYRSDTSYGSAKKLTKTEPIPFSFEERNQKLLKNKQEFIQKILDEEQKLREFHANPIPKMYQRRRANSFSGTSSKNNPDENSYIFKAKPATVLKKKPFEPKKMPHVVEIEEFDLHLERRLQQRKEYDRYIAILQEEKQRFKKLREEEDLRRKEIEIIEMRKMAEHKAQPIRKYKPVEIVYSDEVTQPMSPKFTYRGLRSCKT